MKLILMKKISKKYHIRRPIIDCKMLEILIEKLEKSNSPIILI
jgi:hypothetical protein